jgi:hypothetical protein
MGLQSRTAVGFLFLAMLAAAAMPASAQPPLRGGHIVLPISTEVVTPPLNGDGFYCMVANVSQATLGLRIEMFSALLPLAPLNGGDDCSTIPDYPPGAGCRIFVSAPGTPVYCRIRVSGTHDKDAVRGSLQSQGSDGIWLGSLAAH